MNVTEKNQMGRLTSALPKSRPVIVGINCDEDFLQPFKGADTEHLLTTKNVLNLYPLLKKTGFTADLFVITPPDGPDRWPLAKLQHLEEGDVDAVRSVFAVAKLASNDGMMDSTIVALTMALDLCSYEGEGLIIGKNEILKMLLTVNDELTRHFWAHSIMPCKTLKQESINLYLARKGSEPAFSLGDAFEELIAQDGKDVISAIYFARSHNIGPLKFQWPLIPDRLARKGSELHFNCRSHQPQIEAWNFALSRLHKKPFEITDDSGDFAVTLGPGMVKYFSVADFLEVEVDEVLSKLTALGMSFSLNIPDRYFTLESLPCRGVFISGMPSTKNSTPVNLAEIDELFGEGNWEQQLRRCHAFGLFCLRNDMPSSIYSNFHQWLKLTELTLEECLKAWVKEADKSQAVFESYSHSADHVVFDRNCIFAKTQFVKERLEASEAQAANQVAEADLERLRKSAFHNYVYIMEDLRNKLFKIGKSKTPNKRERTLQSEVPQIVMRFSIPAEEIHEKELHEHFDGKRVRGEWFNLCSEDLVWIVDFLKKRGDASRASVDFKWLGGMYFSMRSK